MGEVAGLPVGGTASAWYKADVRRLSGSTHLEESSRGSFSQSYGGSGLLLTDDDLASDLGSLYLGGGGNDHLNGLSRETTSQPSPLGPGPNLNTFLEEGRV